MISALDGLIGDAESSLKSKSGSGEPSAALIPHPSPGLHPQRISPVSRVPGSSARFAAGSFESCPPLITIAVLFYPSRDSADSSVFGSVIPPSFPRCPGSLEGIGIVRRRSFPTGSLRLPLPVRAASYFFEQGGAPALAGLPKPLCTMGSGPEIQRGGSSPWLPHHLTSSSMQSPQRRI
jgi:hypothetical protein